MLNNVSLDSYNVFKEVYENKNIAQTAAKLNVSPSSISYRIKLLEESLNVKLFERSSGGVEPTSSAEELYYNIKSALEMIKCAERNIIEKDTSNIGDIYIGVHYNIDKKLLATIIDEYSKESPNIRIHIIEKGTGELVSLLEKSKLDIILDFLPVSSDKKDLNVEIMCTLHTAFVKLDGAPNKFILPVIGSVIRTNLDNYLQNNNVSLSMDYEVCTNEMILTMIKNKVGIGYVIKEFIDQDDNQLIEYVDVLKEYPLLQVCVAYTNKNLPLSIKKFIKLVKKNTK